MIKTFCIFICHTELYNFKINHVFIDSQKILMFEVSILIIFCEKYDYNCWLKYKFEDADIVTAQHSRLVAIDHITMWKNKGWPLSCETTGEFWVGVELGLGVMGVGVGGVFVGDLRWSRHTSSKHWFNRNGWVWG